MKTKRKYFFAVMSIFWIVSNFLVILFPLSVQASTMSIPGASLPGTINPMSSFSTSAANPFSAIVNALNDVEKLGQPDAVWSSTDIGSYPSNAQRKVKAPQVSLNFSSDGTIKQGNKLTVTSVPSGFSETTDKLYFTWYIRHDKCGLSDSIDDNNKSCDMDGDDKITVNDWKIEAARLSVMGDYNNNEADYDAYGGDIEKLSGAFALPEIKDGGWKTNYRLCSGGLCVDNGAERDVQNCYVQEPESGLIFELRAGGDKKFDPCPDGWHRSCVKDESNACETPNPKYDATEAAANQQAINEANAHNADPANVNNQWPVPPKYNTPATVKWNVGSACSVFDRAKNLICADENGNFLDVAINQCGYPNKLVPNTEGPASMDCSLKTEQQLTSYAGEVTCSNGGYPICMQDGKPWKDVESDKDNVSGRDEFYGTVWDPICSQAAAQKIGVDGIEGDNSGNVIDNTWKGGFDPKYKKSSSNSFVDEKCTYLVGDLVSGVKNSDGQQMRYGDPSLLPTCTRTGGGKNACKHLFPYFPKNSVVVDGKNLDMSNVIPGDGVFTKTEKEFWKANPEKSSTSGIAQDEAVVIGKGVDKFSWIYADGDQVGLAIEGKSFMDSVHIDGSKKIMWAFSKNICPALSKLKPDSTTGILENGGDTVDYYVETTAGNSVGIITAKFDLNDCLEDNLIDPLVNPSVKMGVTLSATPEQPKNDPTGDGDEVTVAAAMKNSANTHNLFYDWRVEKSLDGASAPSSMTNWKDITTDMQNEPNTFTEADQKGFDKKNFKFKLNLSNAFLENNGSKNSDNIFYLRIRARVGEKEGVNSQNGEGTIVLKVYKITNSIKAYSVTADNEGKLKASSNMICTDILDKKVCSVTKNEIIALEIPNTDGSNALENFAWKVNGESVSCKAAMSADCEVGGNLLFIATTGNEGEAINVEAIAVNKNKNEHITLNKNFKIIAPQVKIDSSDIASAWPKIKGYFKELDGTKTPDYSSTNYQSFSGNTISLKAAFYPSWKEAQADYVWYLDGEMIADSQNNKEISFPADKEIGENYAVELKVSYKPGATDQLNNLRKALYNSWGVSFMDSVEQEDQANIQISIVQNDVPDDEAAMGKTTFPWAANILSHIPEQILFSIRILLTGFLLLFVTSMVFSFIPNTERTRGE
jgi:hypothetical protein